jgi:uracil phosphoribosyltransferase
LFLCKIEGLSFFLQKNAGAFLPFSNLSLPLGTILTRMSLFVLSHHHTIANQFLAEMRDVSQQTDRLRFRYNMERLGEILSYEISKTFEYDTVRVETPLGTAPMKLPAGRVVLATVLRAGLPMHAGMLRCFDRADNAFIAAFRRNHRDGSFDIQLDYVTSPNLDDCILILCDPMIATGASVNLALRELLRNGTPAAVHVATLIGSTIGMETVQRQYPQVHLWAAAVDTELTAKAYIVPGLGDAGDLAYGEK